MIKLIQRENGNILIMFALVFVILLGFVGLATDMILAFNRRDRLTEIAYLMREARLDYVHEIWNNDDPRGIVTSIFMEVAEKNGVDSQQVNIKWTEDTRSESSRRLKCVIEINDTYDTSVLKLFGISNLPIKVNIDSWQYYSSARNDIWNPGIPYERTD